MGRCDTPTRPAGGTQQTTTGTRQVPQPIFQARAARVSRDSSVDSNTKFADRLAVPVFGA